jgi:hypothetical protein
MTDRHGAELLKEEECRYRRAVGHWDESLVVRVISGGLTELQ